MNAAERAAIAAWLGHRPTDRRGLPIPYINRWGPESVETTYVAHDPLVGGRALFNRDVGDTVDLTRQSFQRQRECMVRGLCQVCGRLVPWSRRVLPVAGLAVDWVPVPGRARPAGAVMEPWLDERCAEIAVRWCPALIRRQRDESLTMWPVRSKRDVQMILSVGSFDGDPATKRRPVTMWVKAVLLTLELIPGDTHAGG